MFTVSTKTHGVLDYPTGALTAAAPFVLGFNEGGAETIIPMVVGGTEIVQSLLTDYELGVAKLIPMKTHLISDVMSGLLLAASPFLFGFRKKVWLPHVLVGLFQCVTALMTRTTPGESDMTLPNTVGNLSRTRKRELEFGGGL